MNGHDDVEFHRRKALKLCRTVLRVFEVGFAQELNLYLHIYVKLYSSFTALMIVILLQQSMLHSV